VSTNGHSTRNRVLVVDDDELVRDLLRRVLEDGGYQCDVAADAAQAATQLGEQRFDVLVCDVQLPGESGVDLVRRMVRKHPDTAPIMVSGLDDVGSAETALGVGAYGYLTKPFKNNDIIIAVSNALHRRGLERENRTYRSHLEQLVDERTDALRRLQEETIRRLSRAVEYRDEETGSHVERMSRYCELLAAKVGFGSETMRVAGSLHDVGKIAVPDSILRKPGKLTEDERAEMQHHCQVGFDILTGSGSKLLDMAARIALTHHEKYDGSGYPHGLAGHEIPLEGRIAAVADVFDALTSDRVYRPAFAFDRAVDIMREGRGSHFDPVLLDAFLAELDPIVEIRNQHAD
jgi:putative two-component system response regulator